MVKYKYIVQIVLCKKMRREKRSMRYLTAQIEDNSAEIILNVFKAIAIIEMVIAIIFVIRDEVKFADVEKPCTLEELSCALPLKTRVDMYIDSLELPKEEVYVESYEMEALAETVKVVYYSPTNEERQMAYLIAKSEAGIEDSFGKILVINVAINNMKESGYSNLIEEFTASGRYSSVINGVPCIKQNDEWIPVTEEMLSDELKTAVEMAFEKDYTEELLREVAEAKNLDKTYYEGGALFFYNPDAISSYQASLRENIQVEFRYGRHIFYRIWDE